jgi:hypothetical protein
MRQFAPPVPDEARRADLLFFGPDRYQLPMPTTVAADSKEWNDVDEFALAYGALARRGAEFVLPVIDVYTGPFEKVQRMSTIRTRVFLYQTAQNILVLLLEGRKILTLGRQQFRILHRGSPRRAVKSFSLNLQPVTKLRPSFPSLADSLVKQIGPDEPASATSRASKTQL